MHGSTQECTLKSLQADGKAAFEDIPVFGVCRPACHDSSLYLFVLSLGCSVVPCTRSNFLQQFTFIGVLSTHHLCLCVFMFDPFV